MFIKQLWRFNKAATVVFLFFILLWAYLNYKQGAVAAPCFQYGMFSGKFFIADTQQVICLYADGQPIDLSQYSMPERDLLQITPADYNTEKATNQKVFANMKRVLNKTGIGNLMHENDYTNTITADIFFKWYKQLAEKIIGHSINKLETYQQKYVWKDGQLIPVETPVKLNTIDTN